MPRDFQAGLLVGPIFFVINAVVYGKCFGFKFIQKQTATFYKKTFLLLLYATPIFLFVFTLTTCERFMGLPSGKNSQFSDAAIYMFLASFVLFTVPTLFRIFIADLYKE